MRDGQRENKRTFIGVISGLISLLELTSAGKGG